MKHNIYVPSNVLNFKCQMCGECCKRHWTIIVSKQEYKYIKELFRKKGLNKLFNQSIKIVDKNSTSQYAKIMNDCGKCNFLTEENMCSKQLEFGADALTMTCHNYPREAILTPRGLEVNCNYSCATAAKTLDTDVPITLVKNPENFILKNNAQRKFDIPENLIEFHNLIEEFLLKVIQNRALSIQERLLVLAYITDKTLGLALSNESLPILLNVFANALQIMSSKEVLNKLNSSKPNLEYQLSYIVNALTNEEQLLIIKEDIARINKVFDILNYNESFGEILERFSKEYEVRYRPYEKDIEHIVENYLCQFLFRKEFTKSFVKGFFVMCLSYVLVRFIAVALCVEKNMKLDKDILLEAIRVVEYGFTHNKGYVSKAYEKLVARDQINVPSLISMFKM